MSGVSDVRSYFRARLNSLGLKEWDSPFEEQAPENIIDRSYHVILGEMASIKNNQRDLELNVPVAIDVMIKGYRKNIEGYDKAVTLFDSILLEILAAANRLTQPSIKNILISSAGLERFATSNDNTIRIKMEFLVLVIINL